MAGTLPTFFVVGTQKAATTSLNTWLQQQPDVCLPRMKETNFFAYEKNYELGIEWYMGHFRNCENGMIVGEISPNYMYYRKAAGRIAEWIGNPKIVFIFRHPIDRAFSHYQMTRRGGYEELSFHDALLRESDRLLQKDGLADDLYSYMARGNYTDQVENFRRVFPVADFLYIKFEDLIDHEEKGKETYRNICDFIGVRSSPLIADRALKANVASKPRSHFLRDMLYKPNFVKTLVGRFVPLPTLKQKIAITLDRINQQPVVVSEERYEVPEDIIIHARQEIEKLQRLTGLDLADWQERKYSTR